MYLCFFSNCLYNVALYNIRQQFFKYKTYLRFDANYHKCKANDNYKLLQSNIAQQTLRTVDFAFKSFFATVGKVKSARPPRYRKKSDLYNLIITGNSISIADGFNDCLKKTALYVINFCIANDIGTIIWL